MLPRKKRPIQNELLLSKTPGNFLFRVLKQTESFLTIRHFSRSLLFRKIRNVAIVGHSHSGKTALAEWMLFDKQVISKKPANGQSSLDSDPVEASRHSSVFSHFMRIPHDNFLLEMSDTPWEDFPSDALASLDGADSALLLVSAADGVQTGTINAYQHCREAGITTMICLSKMDRPFLQLNQVLQDLETSLGKKPIPLQVPLFQNDEFQGVESLFLLDDAQVVGKPLLVKNEANGLDEAWTALEEAVAMTNDDLLIDYLENSQLEPKQVLDGLTLGVLQGKILPLVYTSAEQDLGVKELMDAIVAVLPDPIETRQEAINMACKSDKGKCGMEPGVEAGFAARVLHTTVDSFGSVSVLRVISNSRDDNNGPFHSIPHEVVNLRSHEKMKMPSASTSFGLCGKERLPLQDGSHVLPGDVIAVPKLPETVRTNDILTVPAAVTEEEAEISIETATDVLTPLSRPTENVPLMTCATVSLADAGGNKSRGKQSSARDDKLINALAALAREDLAVRVEQDAASGMLLLHCMSSDHLQLLAGRLKERYGLELEFGRPPVQYRETLAKAVTNPVEGKHKKQSGGSGQFGVCYITMEPLEEGMGIEFESRIKGGAISKPFISSVEKGVYEELHSGGPLAGYPVTDVKVILVDGKMHSVDSKDIAFQSAGKQAVKAALERGGTRLLQPMEKVTFVIDESLQGEISSIVSRLDGYVTSTDPSVAQVEMEAILPTAAIEDVSTALRAASAGSGHFTSVFSHYQPVPDSAVKEIIEENSCEEKVKP